ncbi:MAG: uracil-DNA glycosylase family protein [Acidimicrobiales bacterium]
MARTSLTHLLSDVRACTVCAESLPAGPRPIVQVGSKARVVLIGQAPGRRVHESGVPWDDPSGVRLRDWLGLSVDEFYDPDIVAIVPMGFCYPGTGTSGDLPPRPECAPLWHDKLLDHLAEDTLRVILGAYALERYVPDREKTLTATVHRYEELLPDRIVVPHPSPRNNRWLRQNPWFEADAIPMIRARIQSLLD